MIFFCFRHTNNMTIKEEVPDIEIEILDVSV